MNPAALIGILISIETLGQTTLAKIQKSGIQFDWAKIPFLCECVKFIISLGYYLLMVPASPKVNQFSWKRFFQFLIPATLYMIGNNGYFYLLYFLMPAELFMLWNFRIVGIALWLRCIAGRRVSHRQLGALVFLSVGCVLQGLREIEGKESKVLYTGSGAHLIGVVLALTGCSFQALSNVLDEMLMKQRPQDSLMFQNLHMYFWGILVNGLCLFVKYQNVEKSAMHNGFFTGYTGWALVIVFFQSCGGLFISATMRFIDNIAVVHAHAASIIAVLGISVLWFDYQGSILTWMGAACITVATIWYAHEGLPEATAAQKDVEELPHASTPVTGSEAGDYGSLHDKVQQ